MKSFQLLLRLALLGMMTVAVNSQQRILTKATKAPTIKATKAPKTAHPTVSTAPSSMPTDTPSQAPSNTPTPDPTKAPTKSQAPSDTPSALPSQEPSDTPSASPSQEPSDSPSAVPSISLAPTKATKAPTLKLTKAPKRRANR